MNTEKMRPNTNPHPTKVILAARLWDSFALFIVLVAYSKSIFGFGIPALLKFPVSLIVASTALYYLITSGGVFAIFIAAGRLKPSLEVLWAIGALLFWVGGFLHFGFGKETAYFLVITAVSFFGHLYSLKKGAAGLE